MFKVGDRFFYSVEDYEDRSNEVNPITTLSPSTIKLLKNLTNDDTINYTKIGFKYYEEHKYDEAVENFSLALEYKKDNQNALFYRGISYFLLEKFQNGFEDFSKLIEFNPGNVSYYYYRASCSLELKTFSKIKLAIQDFTNAIENDFSVGNAIFMRGICYLILKQEEKSFNDWEVAKKFGIAKMNKLDWKKEFSS